MNIKKKVIAETKISFDLNLYFLGALYHNLNIKKQ